MPKTRFDLLKVSKEGQARIEESKELAERWAAFLEYAVPNTRERSLALTAIEDAVLRSTRALAVAHQE